MADPHIQSPMDGWDTLTVILYRLGFCVSTPMLALLPYFPQFAYYGLLISGVLCASSLHLYLKSFRYGLQFVVWIGLLFAVAGQNLLALGAMLFTLGGLCYKEYFCFRIWGLHFQPILFAILWFSLLLEFNLATQIVSGLSTLLLLQLSIQKWRMPLHFDIGDKRNYQI